ncbi:hypothetical protein PoB_005080100 [Plakobranchus ocellatus]|uniref:Uncharacterized protein n=1 Tax=Plakobranchus ocellatus TaxID=259542 RepID=A0AAV4BLX9_9GAST|nr:hypothetical protein PoB_005080100 [Plakobranchus ocellatus]
MRRRRVSRVFSKFIGGGGGGDSSFPQDYSSNALKGIRQSPPPAAASYQLKGPIASLVVPPQPSRTPRSPLSSHTPRSETTDITVTDMEA